MNSDANTDDFDVFATSAGAALRRPAPDNGLAGVRSSLRRRRISQVAGAGGAAVIVFATGALLLATDQDDSQLRLVPADDIVSTSPDPSTSSTSAPPTTAAAAPATYPYWVPPGTEFASTDLGPLATAYAGPVVAGLSRQIGIEGHPPQVVTASLSYVGFDTATEQVCASEQGSSACREVSSPASWSIAMTSSVDNGDASFDLWTIEGVPENAAFVSYRDGDLLLWQRPIMGFAAFPNVAGNEEIVTAYDVDGTEIGEFGVEQLTAALDGPRPLRADITQAEFGVLSDLTANTVRDCLTSRGGTFTGDVATFPSDVDQVAVWEQCVGETKQVVGAAIEELNPRFYDPSIERPQN